MPQKSSFVQTPQPDDDQIISEFQIDLQGLIKLLAKNLYAEADVFVREMLQNAHDSIKRRREWQGDGTPDGVVRVKIDRQAATVTITDNGAGMTEQEVREYLSTIGRSGTDAFRRDLIEKGRQAEVTVIGQFGIGLLSAFIVADRVVVETRSYLDGNPAWRWESSGEKTYALQPGERQDAGSTVTLHINENYRDMLSAEELRKAIRKYADFLPVGIYLNEDETPTNAVNAPWHRQYDNPKEEVMEMAIFVAKRFPDNPLSTIPIHLTSPYKVDGVLYVSDNRIPDVNTTGLVDIYQSRMFVMEANRDMLPVWAKFVRGIIDSPALTLTASRDAVQQDAIQKEIKEQLGEAIIRHLTNFSKEDPIRFQRLCDWHHYHLKGMALREDNFFRAVADLIPFETNLMPMNLKTYFEEAKKRGQAETDLLYFDERGSATQFYMLCDAQGLLVIDASQVFEDGFLERYGRLHPEIKLRQLNIGESDFIFEPLQDEEKEAFRGLEMEFMRGVSDRRSVAKVVRFKPASIPALTVLTAAAKSQEKLRQVGDNPLIPDEVRNLVKDLMQGERTVPVTLYLNADNSTIQNLMDLPATEDKLSACIAIYNNALMLAQQFLTAKNAEVMFAGFNRVIDRMIAQADEVQKLTTKLNSLKLDLNDKETQLRQQSANTSQTDHVSCFFAMPFDEKYDKLLGAIRQVLQEQPYGWEVTRADSEHISDTIPTNVRDHIAQSHCYLAEVSDGNPNVFLEIGRISQYREQGRPLIYLCRKGAKPPIDIEGELLSFYDPDLSDQELVEYLRQEFGKKRNIKHLRSSGAKSFLSIAVLETVGQLRRGFSQTIADHYKTVGAFCDADSATIAEQTGAGKGSISDAQEYIAKHFKV
ncbi:MAG: ATP-binding protein [Myxacorys chilensis ATA2-1-KO14]|jgi:molecular chaperone HtpG|nr:ATP-binding protein [Myxacorys chilensis ATA2-1-KO14]